MKHGSLFSGIGGFDLAAEWCGWENLWQVEIDPFCQAVLAKQFPNTKRYGDIKNVSGLEAVDVISGGFPCQPFSVAGKQTGATDNRYLWPEMLRIIAEVKPTWIVAENVAGIINMELESVLTSLEAESYEVWPLVIPACAVEAPHRRERVWILGYSDRNGCSATTPRSDRTQWQPDRQIESSLSERASDDVANSRRESARSLYREGSWFSEFGRYDPDLSKRKEMGSESANRSTDVSDSANIGLQRLGTSGQQESRSHDESEISVRSRIDVCNSAEQGFQNWTNVQVERSREIPEPERSNWWAVEPDVGRVAHGVPLRVDRLKSLGNSIVPQIAYQIFKGINRCSKDIKNS